MSRNILLTGIGGQGTILASKLLSLGLQSAGYDVKMSEIHGMSQREGSVLTHVRYGKQVFSPVVEKGQADLIIGFEELEVLRNLDYLKRDGQGIVVLNRNQVNPVGVLSGKDSYPANIMDLVSARAGRHIAYDATSEARALGNARVMNIILLGSIVDLMGLSDIDWEGIIRDTVAPRFVDINLKALARGRELAQAA